MKLVHLKAAMDDIRKLMDSEVPGSYSLTEMVKKQEQWHHPGNQSSKTYTGKTKKS